MDGRFALDPREAVDPREREKLPANLPKPWGADIAWLITKTSIIIANACVFIVSFMKRSRLVYSDVGTRMNQNLSDLLFTTQGRV